MQQLRQRKQASQSRRPLLLLFLLWLALIESLLVSRVEAGVIMKKETSSDDPDIVDASTGANSVPTEMATTAQPLISVTPLAATINTTTTITTATATAKSTATATATTEATQLTALKSESVKFSKPNDNQLLNHVERNEQTIRQKDAQEQQVLATSAIPAAAMNLAIATTGAVPTPPTTTTAATTGAAPTPPTPPPTSETTTISAPENNTATENILVALKQLTMGKVSDSDAVAAAKTNNSITSATLETTTATTTTTKTTMLAPVARSADYARVIHTEEDGEGSTRAAMMLHALIMSTTARNAQSNALAMQQEEAERGEQLNQLATAKTMIPTTSSAPATSGDNAKHSHENSIDDLLNGGNGDDDSFVGVDGEASSQEKDNSTNAHQMNLPNRVEVWSLAGMKLVPTPKTTNASELGNEIEQLARSEYASPLAGNQQLAQLKNTPQPASSMRNATLSPIAESAGAAEAISMSAQLNEIKHELRSTAKLRKPNEPNESLAMGNTIPFVEKTTNTNVGLLLADKKDNGQVAITPTTIAATTTTTMTNNNNNNNSNKNSEKLSSVSVISTTPSPTATTTTTITITKLTNKVPEQNQLPLEENEQRTETNSNKQQTAVPTTAAITASLPLTSTELPLQIAASSIDTTESKVSKAATTTAPRATTTTIQTNENKERNDNAVADNAVAHVQNTNAQSKVDNVDADAAVANRAIIELTSSTTTTRVSALTTSKANTSSEERVTATTKTQTKTTTPPTVTEKSDSKLENKTKPEEEAKDSTTLPITVGTAATTTTETAQISNKVNLEARLKTSLLQNTYTNEANAHVDNDDDVDDHDDDVTDDETLKNDVKFATGTNSNDASPNDLVNVSIIRTSSSKEVITKAAPTTTTTTSTTTEATLSPIKLLTSTTAAAVATTTQAPVVNGITDVRLAGQQQQKLTNTETEAEQQESLLQSNSIGETLQKQQLEQQQVTPSTLATVTKEIPTEATTHVLLPITTTTTTIPITQIKKTKTETETEANVSKNVHEAQQNKLAEVDGDTSDNVYNEDDDMLLPKITTTPTTSTNMATGLINQNITTTSTTTTTPAPIINLLDDSTTTATATATAPATATTTITTPKSIATKIEEVYKVVTTTTSATKAVTELEIETVTEVVTMLPKLSVPTTSSDSDTGSINPTAVTPTLHLENIGGAHNPPTLMDMDNLQTKSTNNTGNGTDVNVIIAITVSVIGVVALILLVAFLYLMRKREKQKCRPVPNLDAYSLDNVSILGGSVRRKNFLRVSKRSYGNAAFDDPSLRHNVLSAVELGKYVERKSSIFEEFRDVPQIIARADEVPVGCEDRNRYANVIPLPETRVMLHQLNNDDKTEYTNANYVRGPKDASNYYIACQAPLESTVCDFWRMIWEQQSRVIIQATDLTENGIEKCAEYLPPSVTLDNHTTYGDFQVTLKNREVKDKYAISTLLLKHTGEKASRELTHYWYKWPEAGVPSEEAPIIAMLLEARSSLKSYAIEQANELKEKSSILTLKSVESFSNAIEDVEPRVHGQASTTAAQKEAESNGNVTKEKLKAAARNQGPLTIHCSPGTGRTGTIIACDMAIRSLETPKRSVDIPQIVYHVRRGRASAVQTKEQYEFIYKVANMYATKITNLSNDN